MTSIRAQTITSIASAMAITAMRSTLAVGLRSNRMGSRFSSPCTQNSGQSCRFPGESIACDGHTFNEDGTGLARTAHQRVAPDAHDAPEHVAQVSRHGDLLEIGRAHV